jgi:hypothetical protein
MGPFARQDAALHAIASTPPADAILDINLDNRPVFDVARKVLGLP